MPDWLDSDLLRQGAVVVSAALLFLAFMVWRIVTRMAVRIVMVGVLVGLAAGVWFYRVELGDCAKTCSCSLFGSDVTVPACEQRIRQRGGFDGSGA